VDVTGGGAALVTTGGTTVGGIGVDVKVGEGSAVFVCVGAEVTVGNGVSFIEAG